MILRHIAEPSDWDVARRSGHYRARSLDTEGFIHCSTEEQLVPVAQAFFAGRVDLGVLDVETERLDVPLRWEPPVGTPPAPGPFPHVYGPIPVSAVVAVQPLADVVRTRR